MDFTNESNNNLQRLFSARWKRIIRAKFLRFFVIKEYTEDKMKIIKSPNLNDFNDYENHLRQRPIKAPNKKNGILSDIGENLFLILISFIPFVFYALLKQPFRKPSTI